jgi:hypothetical protein
MEHVGIVRGRPGGAVAVTKRGIPATERAHEVGPTGYDLDLSRCECRRPLDPDERGGMAAKITFDLGCY